MKKNVKVRNTNLDDTFSITMELERPLLHNVELKNLEENKIKVRKEKTKKIYIKIILGIVLTTIIGFLIWTRNTYKANDIANTAMISDSNVNVEKGDFISFTPTNKEIKKGFIFYPGAKVDPESYAPLCSEIAKNGYKVFIVDMPFNLAVFGLNKAQDIIDKYSNIDKWGIGGHSLGGVMASKFASNNTKIDSVVLLASYPMGDELKSLEKNVLSIWGSVDGVLNLNNITQSKDKLPKDTKYIEIEGANHSQFGDYGLQNGDKKAIISAEDQLKKSVKSIVDLLKK